MKIRQAPAQFRPVTVTFETKDEMDMPIAVPRNVADNRINYPAQHMQAAKMLLAQLNSLEIDDHDD